MSSVKIKPTSPKLKVLNPQTNLHIKNDGEQIVLNKYWRRLIKAGDVEIVKAQVEEPKQEEVKAETKKNKTSQTNKIQETEE